MLPTTLLLLLASAVSACVDADDSGSTSHSVHNDIYAGTRSVLSAIRSTVLDKVLPHGKREVPELLQHSLQHVEIPEEEYIPYYDELKPSGCTGSKRIQHRLALQRARQRALLAAEAIRRPDSYQLYLRELYFNTTDPIYISFVHQKYLHVAAAAVATLDSEGPENVPQFCWDVLGRCPGRPWIYASTITIPGPPTNTTVQHCDRYFDLPADDCSTVLNQWSVTLHELTHAVHWHKPTKDLAYNAKTCIESLSPDLQIMNAQNYQLFAKDVWCRRQEDLVQD